MVLLGIFIIIVSFICLYSVHYNYTGKVTTINEPFKEVKNMRYNYPYFSDEWSAVSMIQYSLDNHRLPLVNPLWYNSYFPNPAIAFHTTISLIMWTTNLEPLIHYNYLSIFFGILIILLIYTLLILNKINYLIAGVVSLSTLYLVNGANLPMLWNLTPLTFGIIFMLLSLIFQTLDKKKLFLLMSSLTVLFYFPLILIMLPIVLIYLKDEKRKILIYFGLVLASASLIMLSFRGWQGDMIRFLFSRVFYLNFTMGAINRFPIWGIIPLIILPLSLIGFFKCKKCFTIPAIIGLVFWIIYSQIAYRFLIGYARIVYVTSIFIILLAGFGLNYLYNKLNKKGVCSILFIIILLLFLVFSFSYTQRDNWVKLGLYNNKNLVAVPNSPVNNYLHEDDLRLFQGIEGKRFWSYPR